MPIPPYKAPSRDAYDIVIVGGAAVGSSTAYWLSRALGRTASILVVERDSSYEFSSTALSTSAVSMDALKALVSIDHILFGSDFPYGPSGQIGYTSESLEALDWSEDDKQRLRQGNASRLFSELRA